MKLNEDSVKKLASEPSITNPYSDNKPSNDINKVVKKNYYFWIDDQGRLTLELVDDQDKTLQECIGITMDTINKINSVS